MSFAPVSDRYQGTEGGSTFRKTRWMRLPLGTHTVRILNSPATLIYTHWIKRGTSAGSSIRCLGDDLCPICNNNEKIRIERPDDFRDVAGYIPWSKRWFTNILDRTILKICPREDCQEDNTLLEDGVHYPSNCWKCTTSLLEVEPTPSNKVKVLSRGPRLFEEKIDPIDLVTQDIEGNPLGITNFDISLVVQKGSNKYPDIGAVAQASRNDVLEVEESELFDLENAVITLEPEEIMNFQRGVSLKDIFAARRSAEQAKSVEAVASPSESSEAAVKDATNAVENLLGNVAAVEPIQ